MKRRDLGKGIVGTALGLVIGGTAAHTEAGAQPEAEHAESVAIVGGTGYVTPPTITVTGPYPPFALP